MQCDGCGKQSTRVISEMTVNGKLLDTPREKCPHCAPESFREAFAAPTDRKVYAEHVARPHLYDRMSDGSLRAKDVVLCGIQDEMDRDPDAEAMEKAAQRKRETRRTTPMRQHEIEQASREWAPIVKEHYKQVAKVEQGQTATLEALVEKYTKISHAEAK